MHRIPKALQPCRQAARRTAFLPCLLLILLPLLPCAVSAQDAADVLPATFSRVSSESQLAEGGMYALVGHTATGQRAVMSHNLNDKGKLEGTRILPADDGTGRIVIDHADDLWQLQCDATGGFLLINPATQQTLARLSNDGLGLQWTEQTGTQTRWQLAFNEAGETFWYAPEQKERTLSVYTYFNQANRKYEYKFDFYSTPDTPHLFLYLMEQSGQTPGQPGGEPEEQPGEEPGEPSERQPLCGSRVTLCHGTQLRLTDGRADEGQDFWLCDSTVAPFGNLDIWTVDSLSPTSFALRRETLYLGHGLEPVSEPAAWQVAGGRLRTTEAAPHYVAYDAAAAQWYVTTDTLQALTATLATVAPAPKQSLSATGVCCLEGGWSAPSLASLPLATVRCLDLTRIALPLHARTFDHLPDTVNLPIFVAEAWAGAVPDSWPFVVACDGSVNALLRPCCLKDKASFFTDRPIRAEAGQLSYVRADCKADGWYSLCLPFEAVSAEAEIFTPSSLQTDTLFLAVQDRLAAGRPALFRALQPGSVTFTCTACQLTAATENDACLSGVFRSWPVPSSGGNVYLFSSSRNAFVRAAAGSLLPPFRAALVLPEAQAAPRWAVRRTATPEGERSANRAPRAKGR